MRKYQDPQHKQGCGEKEGYTDLVTKVYNCKSRFLDGSNIISDTGLFFKQEHQLTRSIEAA